MSYEPDDDQVERAAKIIYEEGTWDWEDADGEARESARSIARAVLMEVGAGPREFAAKCLTCGEPIRVNPHAGLGEPRYVHVVPAGHLALRGPNRAIRHQEGR